MWNILSTVNPLGVRPLVPHRSPQRVLSAGLLVIAIVTGLPFDSVASANPSAAGVRFDVPQWVEGVEVSGGAGSGSDRLVLLELPVSIIVDSFANSGIDQLVVEISPRGGSTMVVDYSPRTELGSEYTGGIEVLRTDESARSVTFGADATPPPLAVASLNAGMNQKQAASYKYNRAAPVHLIAASGTIRRGRGVYFKFRSTDQQIIEGDRLLQVTVRVPAEWRGEWLDVLVLGDRHPSGLSAGVSTFTGMPARPVRVGAGRFLVAVYPIEDEQARRLARRLVDAESSMRMRLAETRDRDSNVVAGPRSLLRHVSKRVDWGELTQRGTTEDAERLLHRALAGTLDPHVDRDFRGLPADVRAVCLDYLEARKAFSRYVRGEGKTSDAIVGVRHRLSD